MRTTPWKQKRTEWIQKNTEEFLFWNRLTVCVTFFYIFNGIMFAACRVYIVPKCLFFTLFLSLSPTIYLHALSSKRTNVLCYVTNSQLYWCWCVWLFLVWQFLPVIGLLNQNDRNRKEWVWKGASCVWCASVCQCLYPPSQKHAFMF